MRISLDNIYKVIPVKKSEIGLKTWPEILQM